jgi:hypothetical protein
VSITVTHGSTNAANINLTNCGGAGTVSYVVEPSSDGIALIALSDPNGNKPGGPLDAKGTQTVVITADGSKEPASSKPYVRFIDVTITTASGEQAVVRVKVLVTVG